MQTFTTERAFEDAVITALRQKGWDDKHLGTKGFTTVLESPTHADLVANFAAILYENNKQRDRLNGQPLTATEMQQILTKIARLNSPVALNKFINGKTITITRDNECDCEHLGQTVALKLYDRDEIAGGQSRYQIARQPQLPTASAVRSDRRGDLMLLINGMPVIHIELKKSGVPVKQARDQIVKYIGEGVFTGLYSLIQVFVGMTPDETVYFASPGTRAAFNDAYVFHWADHNNDELKDWARIVESLLSIPMAHQLVGYYTVADRTDGVLKVMRSYQYFAASRIAARVAAHKWDSGEQRGGFVWHTTGSGKTLTSYKSAELIASSRDADKVVFLMDRIELGTQSLAAFRSFATDDMSVQGTENTCELLARLRSTSVDDDLIVTSIQKMARIVPDGTNGYDIAAIAAKRMVIIIDEAHRDTFGDMLITIRDTFPRALFFGFTGTPIHTENQKNSTTTADIFGDELHRYSIADGIRDRNVLGFDPYMVCIHRDKDIRRAVALEQAHAATEAEALADPERKRVYLHFMDKMPMAGYYDAGGKYQKGIEDYIPDSQYRTSEYRAGVVQDIAESFAHYSQGGRFHAIFATSTIPEAIEYYHLLRERLPELNITALFDPSIDNSEFALTKEEALAQIVTDYNALYDTSYTIPTFDRMKRDIADRLAHKGAYIGIGQPEGRKRRIDLLIVVDQMLTGFDSKWVSTLYLDKVLRNERIIQAFSRTNRLFGHEKPFGIIRYYRRPHTMERLVGEAVRLYSGDKAFALFVPHLHEHIAALNLHYTEIKNVFAGAGVPGLSALPEDRAAVGKFALEFAALNRSLAAARLQGFSWDSLEYRVKLDEGEKIIVCELDEKTYNILLQRYREIERERGAGVGDAPYELETYITEIEGRDINASYMESNFAKYRVLLDGGDEAARAAAEQQLHQDFAYLSPEEQKYASIILSDLASGTLQVAAGETFAALLARYMQDTAIAAKRKLIAALDLDAALLDKILAMQPTLATIRQDGYYDALLRGVPSERARDLIEQQTGQQLPPPLVRIKLDRYLQDFIVNYGKR